MMSIARRRRLLALSGAAGLALAGAATQANAGGFALREQSSSGQGVSFAGMAAGGGSLSGMFWNPAVVTEVEHFGGEQNVTGILPSAKFSNVQTVPPFSNLGDGGDIGKFAVIASGYNAYRINQSLTVGLSVNTPFGLSTVPNSDWAGQLYSRSSRVRSFNATPTVGYQVNDWFSVGAGLQIQYFDIRLKSAVPLATFPTATLKGDDIGVGFTAGFTVKPSDWTSIGVGFRSQIKHKLDGTFKLPAAGVDQNIKANVTLPESVNVGVRQKVSEDLTLLAGVEWTNWSRLDSVAVRGPAPAARSLPFGYKDGWFFSGGAEYAFSQDLTLRGGVAYEKSPVSDEVRSTRLPDDNRWWLSTGGTFRYSEKLTFDLGYSYVFVPGKSKIDVNPGDPDFSFVPFSASARSSVHIVSLGVRYKFGGEAPAALVTKY